MTQLQLVCQNTTTATKWGSSPSPSPMMIDYNNIHTVDDDILLFMMRESTTVAQKDPRVSNLREKDILNSLNGGYYHVFMCISIHG